MNTIQNKLLELREETYIDFLSKLIPNIDKESILGVRTPKIRKLHKSLSLEEKTNFIKNLPHKFYEENLLHMLILNEIKDLDTAIYEIERFVPYMDNWAVTDTFANKNFKLENTKVLKTMDNLSISPFPYGRRLYTIILLKYHTKDTFKEEHLQRVRELTLDNYYVKMGIAWYLSYVLIEHPEITPKYFENPFFEKWIHNKAIQKACESLKLSNDRKIYLKTLKIK